MEEPFVPWVLVSALFYSLGFSLVVANDPMGTLSTLWVLFVFLSLVASVCHVEVQHITILF